LILFLEFMNQYISFVSVHTKSTGKNCFKKFSYLDNFFLSIENEFYFFRYI